MSDTDSQILEAISSMDKVPLLPSKQQSRRFDAVRTKINLIPRQLCLPSKAAVLILFWTAVVSALYKTTEEFALHLLGLKAFNKHADGVLDVLFVYLAFVLINLLYPIAGFLADVYCSRYKVVTYSLLLLLCANGCFCILSVIIFADTQKHYDSPHYKPYYVVTVGPGLLFLVMGLSGYQANIVQLGLDQLLDAPSEYLGLFVHWLEVFTEIGFFLPRPLFELFDNCEKSKLVFHIVAAQPFVFLAVIFFLLFLGYWKRQWFYTESGQRNPYKMVAKVLGFAWKHKYPLRRSAFTYNGDEEPSRIDYAKEKYGGPFTTEQVEDVKTLFKLLTVLLVVGSIFFLEMPLGPLLHNFSDHVGTNLTGSRTCSWRTVLQSTVVLRNISAITFFPLYIWLIYTVLRRCIPRILTRILFGKVLFFLGVMTLFIIDTAGHAGYYAKSHEIAACVFVQNNSNHSSHLGLPWAVNILPAFLMEVADGLVITTTFEFISAQSPHSMKGLVIGIFYAIRGTFKFLGSISVLPFSLSVIWSSDYMKTHMPVITNCGFGYLLLSCTVGVISLVLFCVVAKRYKYRERDDPPFNQAIVERVWANGL